MLWLCFVSILPYSILEFADPIPDVCDSNHNSFIWLWTAWYRHNIKYIISLPLGNLLHKSVNVLWCSLLFVLYYILKHIQYVHTKTPTPSWVWKRSWITFYTTENWPNSPNYGITWANPIHHSNYLASALSHTHDHQNRSTQAHTCCDNRRYWSNTVGHLEWKEERLVRLCLWMCSFHFLCYLFPAVLLLPMPHFPVSSFFISLCQTVSIIPASHCPNSLFFFVMCGCFSLFNMNMKFLI